eukprot:gnl/MRDRNA2_/MRDRNA2_126632_c0_seq1.p1 gnl/MRDRNA2_/MRDRNA2_126632_c0~~gnl/MRDRNA2_/MRDRNA2_126632_c0_seq1.p1  ORF type:complete len:219 (+),score=34.55 gnl/MRDRNA2_/MRDRNA2_126632_c0_seq1:92-748(+)
MWRSWCMLIATLNHVEAGSMLRKKVQALNIALKAGKMSQMPTGYFKEDGDAGANTNYQGNRPGCNPKCWWTCTDPVCEMECEPLCSAPMCQTRCPEMDLSLCKETCNEPECLVICPQNRCSMAHCPECKTVCGSPTCKVDCGKPEDCDTVCAEPTCEWKCARPGKCEKPKCNMVCEKEGCQGNSTDVEDHSFGKGKGLPDVPEGHFAVSSAKAKVTGL